MPVMYQIKFLPDGPVIKFAGSRGNYYELEDQSRLDMQTAPVWCHQCGKITHGESIEPLAKIDKGLADLNDPKSGAYRVTMRPLLPGLEGVGGGEEFRLGQIEKAKQRRAWRVRRVSGPKCILCGSTNIFESPYNQQVPSPTGQGSVVLTGVGLCSTQFNEWFFTPEGDRIAGETMPTRWKIRREDGSGNDGKETSGELGEGKQ